MHLPSSNASFTWKKSARVILFLLYDSYYQLYFKFYSKTLVFAADTLSYCRSNGLEQVTQQVQGYLNVLSKLSCYNKLCVDFSESKAMILGNGFIGSNSDYLK